MSKSKSYLVKNLAVIGLGLIGGSFALDIKRCLLAEEVWGFDRSDAHGQEAVRLGVVDAYKTDWSSLQEADLIVLAVPVRAVPSLLKEISPYISKTAVVSDVGSVKGPIVELMEQDAYQHIDFIGGHPISGSEQFGPGSARFRLFENKRFIMTPTARTSKKALELVEKIWGLLGSDVHLLDPATHDHIFAEVSHLPHLLAYACMQAFGISKSVNHLSYSGAGLKDFSRIAASSPEMWSDIFLDNKTYLLSILESFQTSFNTLRTAIQNEDRELLMQELTEAKILRDQWV